MKWKISRFRSKAWRNDVGKCQGSNWWQNCPGTTSSHKSISRPFSLNIWICVDPKTWIIWERWGVVTFVFTYGNYNATKATTRECLLWRHVEQGILWMFFATNVWKLLNSVETRQNWINCQSDLVLLMYIYSIFVEKNWRLHSDFKRDLGQMA